MLSDSFAVELISDEDRFRLLHKWNDTGTPLPDLCVAELFERQVERTPAEVAVETDEFRLSYAEVNGRANRFARCLVENGVRAGDTVGILMARSADLVIALIAVAKVGAAYVPVDARSPGPRISSALRSAGCSLLVVDSANRRHEVTAPHRVVLGADGGEAGDLPRRARNPDALLYVMHTSGSSGEPKGVEVTHRNVAALALDRIWQSGNHRRVLFHSPHAFDASTYELWVPLLSGGRVVVAPEDVNASLLRRLGREGRVTSLWLTAGVFQALAEGDPGCLEDLREVWTGGDVVPPRAVRLISVACPRIRIFNGYGPTETTTFAARFQAFPRIEDSAAELPIGSPMDNTRVYVLDEQLRLLPQGVRGQLYIAGAGVARGYAGRPDLTADRFLPDPFGPPGERMYASGDLAEWNGHGELMYLGRADRQVKLNGFRIEPGEIETVLREHAGVAHTVVDVEMSGDGGGQIIAYVVAAGDACDRDALRAYASGRLPGYMVPAEFVFLNKLPLTANGKIDRDRLAACADRSLSTPTERYLARLWSELLERSVTSPDASFWELGGHSLRAVTLLARLRKQLGVRLRLRDLFKHARLVDLAAFIDAQAKPSEQSETRPETPASSFQTSVWVAQRLEAEPSLYNVPSSWRVSGRLEPQRLAAALARVIADHEVLRTTFTERQGTLWQVIGAPWQPVVATRNCADAAELAAHLRTEADQPFDPSAGPLLRLGLIETPDQQVLTLTLHHMIVDFASLPVIVRDLDRHYTESAGAAANRRRQYRELTAATERVEPGAVERSVNRLRGAPSRLPVERPRQPERNGVVPLDLPDDVARRMRSVQDEFGASWFMVATAALAALLHGWTGCDDLTLGFPVDTRPGTEFSDVVGPCLNMVALRSTCTASTTVAELLAATRDGALDALEDQTVPYEAVVNALNPPRSAGSTPYLDVVLAPQVYPATPVSIGGCELIPLPDNGFSTIGKFALTLGLTLVGERMTGSLLYRGDRVSAATAAKLAREYTRMLDAVLSDRSRTVASLRFGTTSPASEITVPERAATNDDTERRVAGIWSTVLGEPAIGPHDNFFDRGGNSLKLVTLHAELCRAFGVELPLQRLFESSTVRSMAAFLDGAASRPQTSTATRDVAARGAARRARSMRRAG